MRAASGLLAACLALLVSSAAPARAGFLNFMWNDCPADGGVTATAGTCDTDAGLAASAVGSYALTYEQPLFVGVEVTIEGQVQGATSLPDWWQFFNPGSCRQSALSAAFTFPGQARVHCHDEWGGVALGGIAAYQTSTTQPAYPGSDPTRFRVILAAAVQNPIDLLPGVEYLSFVLNISNAGTTTCAGCATPAWLWLTAIKSAQQDGSGEVITNTIVNNMIYWDGATTAAVNRSWGQVKGLYR